MFLKKYQLINFYACLQVSFLMNGQASPPITLNQPINITLTANPHTTVAHTVTQDCNQVQKSTMDCIVKFAYPDTKFMKDCFKSMHSILDSTRNSIQSHPFKTIAALTLVSYVWINYHIQQTCKMLNMYNSWCNWKPIISLSSLHPIAAEQAATQLKIDIYKKYALIAPNASTCDYTCMFINDIKSELVMLNNYLYWSDIMEKIGCIRLFYFRVNPSVIEDKKARLLLILDFFMTQFAENYESKNNKNVLPI